MNPAVKELWLTALRSGKYKQGKKTLKRLTAKGTTHCCLGVLCEIAVAVGVVSESCGPDETRASVIHEYGDGRFGFPPQAVYEWADLKPYDAEVLASLNDAGDSFAVIADFINEHL